MTYFLMNMAHAEMYLPRMRAAFKEASVDKADAFWSWDIDGESALEYKVENGVAVVDVKGAIASAQIPLWFFYADLTYENIVETVKDAVNDPDVTSVILRISSPGGTVLGCAEAAAQIDALSQGEKPVVAFAHMADSAAYWLAAATNAIYVDPTGEVGSIGVITWHYDYSKFYEDIGIAVTPLKAGRHKDDGHPFAPLTDQARARIEAEIEYLRDRFAENVSVFRGMKFDDVKKTEAITYIGQLGVDAGLADEVMYFKDLLEAPPTITPQP